LLPGPATISSGAPASGSMRWISAARAAPARSISGGSLSAWRASTARRAGLRRMGGVMAAL
jgi:hypothetical protein